MHAEVPRQKRLVTSASTPYKKAPRIIKTQSHQLNDFTNPQERTRLRADDQQKTLHDAHWFLLHKPKVFNNQIFQNIPKFASTTSHHQHEHATSKSATKHRNVTTTVERLDKTTRTSTRLRDDDQHKPLHDPEFFPQESKDSNSQIFLALTRQYARQGLASTTSHLKRKHATSKSITYAA